MKQHALIRKVHDTIVDHRMVDPGDRVLVAVSGGGDSVALVHILHRLQEDLRCDLHMAHLNHELRGTESIQDARFVGRLADSLGLPLASGSAGGRLADRPEDLSLEAAARQVRYEFLEETATRLGARRIATGHTADDQAETVLMRMIQGAGPGGLAGIRPVRDGRVIRPLIRCSSDEITAYLEAAGLAPCTDSSNLDPTFLRNRVRLRLLPILEREFNPNIVSALSRTSAVQLEVDRYLRAAANGAMREMAEESRGKIRLALARLEDYDLVVRVYILRAAIEEILGGLTDISYDHIDALLRLIRSGETPFKQVTLPGSLVAYPERGMLVLMRREAAEEPEAREIAVPGTTDLPPFGLEIHASFVTRSEAESRGATPPDEALFDWDTLCPPLRARGWRRGDQFHPSGMRGRKKLQDFFVDEKVPRSLRSRTALLVDERAIHWIVGYRTSEPSRVRDHTWRVLLVKAAPRAG